MAAAKQEDYELLLKQAQALLAGEDDWIANVANLSSLLFYGLQNINFAGVYRMRQGELILGPFQGKPACVHIALGSGVCGTAAQTKKAQIVPNVHHFSGHIACDSASNSEIVVPIFKGQNLWGVFDFDSPRLNNFDHVDQKYLTRFAQLIFMH